MVSSKTPTTKTSEVDNSTIKDLAKLYPYEQKWVSRRSSLLQKGFELRPRFRPGWKPSWQKFEWLPRWIKYGLMNPYSREDALPLMWGELIMDAVRVSDGAFVIMKIIDKRVHPDELGIARYLTGLRDERNHCVPVWDSFDAPDDPTRTIIVMPLLRKFDDPPFETVGEVLECIRQLLEGLQFMHEHNVAHRDCFTPNIMMNATPLYPKPFHPSKPDKRRDWKGPAKHISRTDYYQRTGKHVKYYFIDFGISKRCSAGSPPARELPIIPADKSVPEHQGALYNKPSDPFATDVYLLGNAFRERFLKRTGSDKLQFMSTLIAQMTAANPQARPKIGEVVARFATLSTGDISLRLIPGSKESRPTNSRRAPALLSKQPGSIHASTGDGPPTSVAGVASTSYKQTQMSQSKRGSEKHVHTSTSGKGGKAKGMK